MAMGLTCRSEAPPSLRLPIRLSPADGGTVDSYASLIIPQKGYKNITFSANFSFFLPSRRKAGQGA